MPVKDVLAELALRQGDLVHLALFAGFLVVAFVGARLAAWVWRRTMGRFAESQGAGMRTTKVLTLENTVVVIPNKELASSRITNLVYPDYRLRLITQLGVAYGTDLRHAKLLIEKVLSEQEEVLSDPPPSVAFIESADPALVLRVAFWIRDYRRRYEALDAFNMAVNDLFASEHIEIPFPQRVLHVEANTKKASMD